MITFFDLMPLCPTASTDSQSGHIVKEITDEKGATHVLNMRIETVPTSYGQDAVIRLFNFDSEMLNMDVLGLDDNERRALDEIVSHPRGMVMVVGPTGSGKSTTLYSIINALNDPSRKILTLEDPVEFDVPGISQIPVDTTNGKSFADELRTVLRPEHETSRVPNDQ
jgi:type II secretory ATPase GspE/PulE/Tfp pilus assembly ATPase PilB-like protein